LHKPVSDKQIVNWVSEIVSNEKDVTGWSAVACTGMAMGWRQNHRRLVVWHWKVSSADMTLSSVKPLPTRNMGSGHIKSFKLLLGVGLVLVARFLKDICMTNGGEQNENRQSKQRQQT